MVQKLYAYLREQKLGRVLEIGTGLGNFTKTLVDYAGNFSSLTSVDMREDMIMKAKETVFSEQVEFVHMNGEKLSFPKEFFDTVCISNTLHEIEEKTAFFTEVKRVLKKGGKLLLNEMVCDGLSERQKTHMLLHHFGADLDMLGVRYHGKTYTREELFSILEGQGFSSESYQKYLTHEEQEEEGNMEEEKREAERVVSIYENKISQIEEEALRVSFEENLS